MVNQVFLHLIAYIAIIATVTDRFYRLGTVCSLQSIPYIPKRYTSCLSTEKYTFYRPICSYSVS
jgi:hypothetical protein